MAQQSHINEMITPVNQHVLIEPIEHKGFMASQNETYQEVGIIVSAAEDIDGDWTPEKGEKVYFDSWLAAKYPKEGSTTNEFYWLVKWSDVRAVEAVVE